MDAPSFVGLNIRVWILFVAVLLVAAAAYAYRRTTPPVTGRIRWILIGLRTLTFLLIVFLLFDPRYVYRSRKTDPPVVIAAIDRSASMALPTSGWTPGTGPSRFEEAIALSEKLKQSIEKERGKYIELYFSDDLMPAAADSVKPDGQGTDIIRSITAAYNKYETENLTALVVFSDGVDTEARIARKPVPSLPVFTVGLGDTSAPEDVRIRDVEYNAVVRSPSRTPIQASVHYSGANRKRIRIRLTEGNNLIHERDTLITPNDRDLVYDIPVDFPAAGRRKFLLETVVDGYDAEPSNNRREIVIEAEKSGVKVLIVDLRPSWELHFLTGLLRKDESFDFDVTTLVGGQIRSGAGKIRDPGGFLTYLGKYDALVIASVSDEFLSGAVAQSIKSYVRDGGKGLLVLPGPSSLFERPAAWAALSDILPLNGTPPHHFHIQYTSVLPGQQAVTNPITAQLIPILSQRDWQQRSPLLGYYAPLVPKSGVDVLLETEGRRTPVFVYQALGKGRVAVLSAGPLWRWKFLADGNNVYDEIVSRLLDVLSRGESSERFLLTSKKNVYDAGESPQFSAEILNEKMQPVTGIPVRIELAWIEEDGREVPLRRISMIREGADNARFRGDLGPLAPGRYRVRGEAELPGREIASQPVEISVSGISVEYQRVSQDRENLVNVALRSGGAYVLPDGIDALSGRIDLRPRSVESLSEATLRANALLFLAILLCLGVEWVIRKRVGMI